MWGQAKKVSRVSHFYFPFDRRGGDPIMRAYCGTLTCELKLLKEPSTIPKCLDCLKKTAILPKIIDRFEGPFRPLSNFSPYPVRYKRGSFPTVEHAYQAYKTYDPVLFEEIRVANTPGRAKRIGRSVDLRRGWNGLRLGVMKDLVEAKFRQNEQARIILLKTGDREIVEGNTWNDTFWGVCNGVGENQLGKILMYVRKMLVDEIMGDSDV